MNQLPIPQNSQPPNQMYYVPSFPLNTVNQPYYPYMYLGGEVQNA